MVRVKTKARKGDEAFTTRKQKVGRKKLTPVTATRAEVHARTLRLTAPAAITRAAIEEISFVTENENNNNNINNKRGIRGGHREKEEEKEKILSAEQIHRDFKEHLCGTRHYKKAVRGSAFMSLARSITNNYELLRKEFSNNINNNDNNKMNNSGDDILLSPLELLSAFTSALDAMSDTDDDVRRAALATLKVILNPPNDLSINYETNTNNNNNNSIDRAGRILNCDLEQTRAILRVVDVTLTHAMMSVRRSGVELLYLILQINSKGVRLILNESEVWVKMASRVSAIIMYGSSSISTSQTTAMKLIHVIPELLETMLQKHHDDDGYETNGEEINIWSEANDIKKDKKLQGNNNNNNNNDNILPKKIVELLDECAPKWSMAWKELMELRAALFRDCEWVKRATAIARAFACITLYLREHHLLKRSHAQLIGHLFTVKVPFTMRELITNNHISNNNNNDDNSNNNNNSGISRIGLANAIADACLPVAASSDEAWQVLREFLSIAFRGVKEDNNNNNNNSIIKRATHLLGPLRTLHMSIVRFPETLLQRLLFLIPSLMQSLTRTVMKFNNNNNNNNNNQTVTNIKIESTALIAALLKTSHILSILLVSTSAVSSQHGLRFLAEAILILPRLLFALREFSDNILLLDHVVFSFLKPLWQAVSSGHPLLQYSSNNNINNNVAAQLRVSLPSLFELRVPNTENPNICMKVNGVLYHCSESTVELASHILFYLNGEISSGVMEEIINNNNKINSITFPVLACTLPCC